MKKIVETIRNDRLYILLLIFIILVNIASSVPFAQKKASASVRPTTAGVEAKSPDEDIAVKQLKVERLFQEDRSLALLFGLAFLLIVLVMLLGIVINAILLSSKSAARPFDIRTYRPGPVKWSLRDVAKVAILFLFFGYIAIMIETALYRTFPLLKNDNFRMVLNSSVLDILTIALILYFTVGQYKEKLVSLGISGRNFFRNVFYGIAGYIAAAPILAALLVITIAVVNLLKYVPQKQPVVELFLKEGNMQFLMYTGIFAAVVGPVIEELFFRGFMYNALKKYVGIMGAMLVTAVIFAVLHANVASFLPITALGLLLAYMYEKTGTLVASITVHIAHNMGMVLFVFLIRRLGV